jgi:hypothetical protein
MIDRVRAGESMHAIEKTTGISRLTLNGWLDAEQQLRALAAKQPPLQDTA